MTDTEMMTIGEFAKSVGLTASALRFYDDAGLLRPERVDAASGYRFYADSQLPRAVRLRQLRDIGMSLPTVAQCLAGTEADVARLIDEHLSTTAAAAEAVKRAAATVRASLSESTPLDLCETSGPVLSAAIDQVLVTTVDDPEAPVLSGVHVEVAPDAVSLIATDRYRLAVRTLVPKRSAPHTWSGTVDGEDLRRAVSKLRRSAEVSLKADSRTLVLTSADGPSARCALLTEPFPDYHQMLDALAPVTNRVAVRKQTIVKVLERAASAVLGLNLSNGTVSVLPERVNIDQASATGADLTVWFDLATLYPALVQALGPDVLIDIRGVDQPATVRSADNGDLTTLTMPRRAPSVAAD